MCDTVVCMKTAGMPRPVDGELHAVYIRNRLWNIMEKLCSAGDYTQFLIQFRKKS